MIGTATGVDIVCVNELELDVSAIDWKRVTCSSVVIWVVLVGGEDITLVAVTLSVNVDKLFETSRMVVLD